MKIGSHVSMSAPDYILGSVKEMLSYNESACMLYTGAPQNTIRKPMEELKIKEAQELLKEHNISLDSVIVHAPYIINLGNACKKETFELGVSFLVQEIQRVKKLGAQIIVLHPGAHVKEGEYVGLNQIVKGLNEAFKIVDGVKIALETMAGKGSEVGYCFDHLKYIIDHVEKSENLAVCMDTCHLHDAGFDLKDFDNILKQFDEIVGLERLACIHINDSKNIRGAKKDRHENIGFGEIGFDTLCSIVHHPLLEDVVKILETPHVDGFPPYKFEIEMLLNKQFDPNVLDRVRAQ